MATTRMEMRVDTLERNTERVEEEVKNLRTEVGQITNRLSTIEGDIDELKTQFKAVGNLNQKLEILDEVRSFMVQMMKGNEPVREEDTPELPR